MKLEIHLEEHETEKDITPLTLTHSLYKLINEKNSKAENKYCFESYIFAQDIADLITVMANSQDRYYKMLKDMENIGELGK